MSEIRLAVRSLLRTPAFTLSALLTLALGIGATTAIFCVTYSVLLKPLPYPESERLFVLAHQDHASRNDSVGIRDSGLAQCCALVRLRARPACGARAEEADHKGAQQQKKPAADRQHPVKNVVGFRWNHFLASTITPQPTNSKTR